MLHFAVGIISRMRRANAAALLLACAVLGCPGTALAMQVPVASESGGGWQARIESSAESPQRLVVVDKGLQRLHVFRRESPLALETTYDCTTGQKQGDKVFSGDLRTPEGVYFVVDKVRQRLDFGEYGTMAYALNYPSPMDKLRGKTGHGIWIHSRGRPITPLETRGCIAVNLDDMDGLSPRLMPGTAVVVANSVVSDARPPSAADEAINQLIVRKTSDWNRAWAARSSEMFDFYAPEAYTKAQNESFAAFKGQKERLFGTLPWIQILHGEIRVLRGPDYWVSWFPQFYRAPNTTSEGTRRLYWQPDTSGELRIVGMEWIPEDLGLSATYLESVTPSVVQFIETWREAWERGDIAAYMKAYSPQAVQAPRSGAPAIEQHKKVTWGARKPTKVQFSGLRVMVENVGVSVDMMQEYRDSSGYRDKGVKRVLLHPKGDSWVIAVEEWSAVAP